MRSTGIGIGLAVVALAFPHAGAQPTSPVTSPGVVRAVDVDVSVEPDTGLVREEIALLVDGSGVSTVDVDLDAQFVVERSSATAGVVEHRHSGRRLRLIFDPPLDGPRGVRLRISGRPRRGADDRVNARFAVLDPAAGWYPRTPAVLHEARVRVRVPPDWTVAGPGAASRNDDGSWTFRPDRPVRGLAIAAAPGLTASTATAVRTSVRVVAGEDDPGASTRARDLADPLAWFAASIAPYPFDGFTLAVVPGLDRRVEGSGVVAVPVQDAPVGRADYASVLAGQWYGQWIGADGPWIRSFGAWHAWAYAVDRSLAPPRDLAALRQAYLDLPAGRDVPIARAGEDAPAETLLGKGSAAPEMIRQRIGARAFSGFLDGLAALAPDPVTIGDLRALVRTAGGSDGVAAFDEWFDRRGVPRLDATLRVMPAASGGHRADLRLAQNGGVYSLSVEVVFVGAGQEHREVVELTEPEVNVFYLLPFEPRRVEIDPLNRWFLRPSRITGP